MSRITVINQLLINDEELKSLLAESTIEEGQPAVYETWGPKDAEMPYINLTYNEAGSTENLEKRQGELSVDIFVNNHDTLTAEKISRRINTILLKKRQVVSPTDGKIRIYKSPSTAGIIPEQDTSIVHDNQVFELYWWDKENI